MEIPQIKDKITARAFALALSVKLRGDLNDKYSTTRSIISLAKEFENYIIGDAELPEVAGDPNMKILDMWSKVNESTKIECTNETNIPIS